MTTCLDDQSASQQVGQLTCRPVENSPRWQIGKLTNRSSVDESASWPVSQLTRRPIDQCTCTVSADVSLSTDSPAPSVALPHPLYDLLFVIFLSNSYQTYCSCVLKETVALAIKDTQVFEFRMQTVHLFLPNLIDPRIQPLHVLWWMQFLCS